MVENNVNTGVKASVVGEKVSIVATGKARVVIGNPKYGELLEMPTSAKNKPIFLGKKKVAAVLAHLEEAKKFVSGEIKAVPIEWTEKTTHAGGDLF